MGKVTGRPLSPTEICEQVKYHYAEIRKVITDVFGRCGNASLPEKFAYPEQVRQLAYETECAFNRVMVLEFGELHVVMGLGPITIGAPCGHTEPEEKEKG